MKKLIGRILCAIGLHEWQYGHDATAYGIMVMRLCDRCCRAEHEWVPRAVVAALIEKDSQLVNYPCEGCGAERVERDFGMCPACTEMAYAVLDDQLINGTSDLTPTGLIPADAFESGIGSELILSGEPT